MPSGIYKRVTLGRKRHETIGKKFGRLLVLSYVEEISEQIRMDTYLVRCDCGKEKTTNGKSLRSGNIRSCGCLQREIAAKVCKKTGSRIGENASAYSYGDYRERTRLHKFVHAQNKVCQMCGKIKEENGRRFSVHHLDGDHYNNDLKNGALLCNSCHAIVTKTGNVWRPELCLSL